MRYIYITIGLTSVALGVLGAFLPILPTTPFLLLALWCFSRSSERLREWLLNNRYFGEYLRNYSSGQGIPLRVKVYALTLLWSTILATSIFATDKLVVRIILPLIAIGVTIHLTRIKTKRNDSK